MKKEGFKFQSPLTDPLLSNLGQASSTNFMGLQKPYMYMYMHMYMYVARDSVRGCGIKSLQSTFNYMHIC